MTGSVFTVSDVDACPKCGRGVDKCYGWRYARQHFYPSKTRLFSERGVKVKCCHGCGEKKSSAEFWVWSKGVCKTCRPLKKRMASLYPGLTPGSREYNRASYLRRLGMSGRPCKGCGKQREVGRRFYCLGCENTPVLMAKAAHKAAKNRRRAYKLGNGGSFSGMQFKELCDRFGNRCLSCGVVGVNLTVDHVIPLSKGGSNGIENIQPLCHLCNARKSDNVVDFRYASGGSL